MKIKKEIVEQIFKHGKKESPLEACGYLAGKGNTVTRYFPMKNMDQSGEHFSLDPKEQFSVIRQSRSEGLEIIGICHTHPETPARPSDEDIKLAYDPNIIYVIASLVPEIRTIKAFRIVRGNVENIELTTEDEL